MRLQDLTDWWLLRSRVTNPRDFLGLRRAGTDREIRLQLRTGASVTLRGGTQDASIFREVFARDVYGLNRLEDLDCVVDAGANVGYFSVAVAERARRVIACEPQPGNLERLRSNTAGLKNVTIEPVALGAADGTVELFTPASPRATGRFRTRGGAEYLPGPESVPCLSLATLFERHGIERCELLKLDVEGAEGAILAAAPGEVWERIERIHGELHAPTGASELEELCRRHGMRVELRPQKRPGSALFRARRR